MTHSELENIEEYFLEMMTIRNDQDWSIHLIGQAILLLSNILLVVSVCRV